VPGAGRGQPLAAPPPGEQAHHSDGTRAHDYPSHDHENMQQLGRGAQDHWGSVDEQRATANAPMVGLGPASCAGSAARELTSPGRSGEPVACLL
jgi:hypothetical protein